MPEYEKLQSGSLHIIPSLEEGRVLVRIMFQDGDTFDVVMNPEQALDVSRELQHAAMLLNTLECPCN